MARTPDLEAFRDDQVWRAPVSGASVFLTPEQPPPPAGKRIFSRESALEIPSGVPDLVEIGRERGTSHAGHVSMHFGKRRNEPGKGAGDIVQDPDLA